MKKSGNIIFYACICVIAIALLKADSMGQPDLSDSSSRTLSLGYSKSVFSCVDINDAKVAIDMFVKYLKGKMDVAFHAETVILNDVEHIVSSIKNKRVDGITLNTLDYLRIKDRVSLEPFSLSIVGESIGDEYVVLVNKNRGITRLNQLRNKTLIVEVARNGDIGLVWFTTLLMKEGLPESGRFLKNIKKVEKISKAVLPVFFQQADACLATQRGFKTMAELNPQIGEKLRVLTKSPLFLGNVFCFRKDYDEEIRALLFDVVIELHLDAKGKQVLMLFRNDRIIPFKPEYIESVEALMKEYRAVKK
ncbi:MAG: phosphate/phosphite/phosphonate ABC transporter substrate-binding protein [Bacteroidetes bacterium]|nr:phosphate/phosphite/phosphonate ABC transporter substrate-binding protein [Bacteroidota bacterium]